MKMSREERVMRNKVIRMANEIELIKNKWGWDSMPCGKKMKFKSKLFSVSKSKKGKGFGGVKMKP